MLHSAGEHISRIERMAARMSAGGNGLTDGERKELGFLVDGLVNSRIWNDKELSELLDLSKSTINRIAKGYPDVGEKTYNKLCSRLPKVLSAIRESVISVSETGVGTTMITIHNQHRRTFEVEGWYHVSEEDYDRVFVQVKSNILKLIAALKEDNEEYIRSAENKLILKSALISLLETSLSMLRPDGHIEIGFVRSVSKNLKDIVRQSSEAALGKGVKGMLDQVGSGLADLIKAFLT